MGFRQEGFRSRRQTLRTAMVAAVAGLAFTSAAASAGSIAPHASTAVQVQRALRVAQRHLRVINATRGETRLKVSGSGFSPEAAIVVTQCSSQALAAAAKQVSSALDYCDQNFVALTSSGRHGSFTVASRALPVIQTASGPVDCRRVSCLLGALNLDVLEGKPLQVAIQPLHFSGSGSNPTAAPRRDAGRRSTSSRAGRRVSVRHPIVAHVLARPAGPLGAGRIGQVLRIRARKLPRRPVAGEGLLALTMTAPGTSWSNSRDTSVVVQARVGHAPWQTMVLFAGARPFTYEGFTGPLRSGRQTVRIRIERSLSHVSGRAAVARLRSVSLRVVRSHSLAGVELAHAPVLYDRLAATTRDTPLITYAAAERLGHGSRRLAYVVTWTREDAGTGFLPWLEWGTWGRMTDIETAISFDVNRRGAVSGATYLTCSECGPRFPDSRTALNEVEQPFRGRWFHHHPILRVSTGNNDFSDQGTTPLRFQQALAAPPRPGATREGAMDRNPWTYELMGQELKRARADYSTSASSAGPGDPRQYLILQIDSSVRNVAAVGVDLRLAGSNRTYTNDLGTTYPLYAGGRGRTVVKVPLGAVSHRITHLGLRLLPSSGTPSIVVHSLRVLQFKGGRIMTRRIPEPQVSTEPIPPPASSAPVITAVPTR
jgi:hypothetical protein